MQLVLLHGMGAQGAHYCATVSGLQGLLDQISATVTAVGPAFDAVLAAARAPLALACGTDDRIVSIVAVLMKERYIFSAAGSQRTSAGKAMISPTSRKSAMRKGSVPA